MIDDEMKRAVELAQAALADDRRDSELSMGNDDRAWTQHHSEWSDRARERESVLARALLARTEEEVERQTIAVAIFLEGKFREVVLAEGQVAAEAFAQGYCLAVDHARGNSSVYLLPQDRDQMIREEDLREARHALLEAGLA